MLVIYQGLKFSIPTIECPDYCNQYRNKFPNRLETLDLTGKELLTEIVTA